MADMQSTDDFNSNRHSPRKPEPENDEHLTPEQRRARAIEKAMDAAIKGKSNKRRTKKDEVVCSRPCLGCAFR